VTGPVILALLLLLLFIPLELRTARPLLDVRLFQRRNFLVGNLIGWVTVASLFGSTFLLPQYLQVLRGLSSYHAGLLLAPQGLAAMVGTIVVGLLYSRVGARPLVLVGGIAVGINIYLINRWATLTSPFALLIPLLIVQGLALPFLVQTTGTAALTGEIHPLLWRPETFGLTHQLSISNRTEVAQRKGTRKLTTNQSGITEERVLRGSS